MPVCANPTRLILVVLNAVSAARATKSPGFMPSANNLTNGALSEDVAGKPITLAHNVETIASLVVGQTQ